MPTMRSTALLALLACGACVADPLRHIRPARFALGMNAHHFASPAPSPIAARSDTPMTTTRSPHDAVSFSAQFALALLDRVFVGLEAQGGQLSEPGSNFAAGLGVAGVEMSSHLGAVAAEVAAGWRSLRYSLDGADVKTQIVEPRIRGYLWLSSQFTVGAVAGATFGDRGWMGGVYFAVHSKLFDSFLR